MNVYEEALVVRFGLFTPILAFPHQGGRNLLADTATRISAHPAPPYFLTPTTPSPLNVVVNPARCKRLATSAGTSRPLVSLFGVPV